MSTTTSEALRQKLVGLPELLRPEETAMALRMSVKTVYRLCKRGILQPLRVGGRLRFRRADVARFLGAAGQAD